MRAVHLAFATLAATCAVGAFAQGSGQGDGWYLGGATRPARPAAEDTDIGYRHFGGYRFTRNWGVELGYSDLGHGAAVEPGAFALDKYGYPTSAWTLAGTGVLSIGGGLSLQGRLGWSLASPDATLAAAGPATGAGATGQAIGSAVPRYRSGVLWGFGGRYDLSTRFGLRVDYNNFGRLDAEQGGARSDLWSLNAIVRF